MDQAEVQSTDSALAVLCFCYYAGQDIEQWSRLQGRKVAHRVHGQGIISNVLEVYSGVSLRVHFYKSARDFPLSFRVPEIMAEAHQWKMELPSMISFPEEIVYAAMECIEEETERNRQRHLEKERDQQEQEQIEAEARRRRKKEQHEWDAAILSLRETLKEVYYITPIANLGSIFDHGVLSHDLAKQLPSVPKSIAMEEVQARRDVKLVRGKRLHSYANFYFNPRNPMMSARREHHNELCIIGVDISVLDLPRVVVSDGNAANGPTSFRFVPDGLAYIDWEVVLSRQWKSYGNPDYKQELYRKRVVMAEVLVPQRVPPSFIRRIYTSGSSGRGIVQNILRDKHSDAQVIEAPYLFFRSR